MTPMFQATLVCECGNTRFPHRSAHVGRLRDEAAQWAFDNGFAQYVARRDEQGKLSFTVLQCPVCRSQLRVVIGRADNMERDRPAE